MKTFGRSYRAIVEPDHPQGYVAILPAVPGLMAHGESEETAVELLNELLRNHLIQLENAGQPLPDDGVEILWDEEDEQAGAKLVHIEV
ncbi:MAG: type II toxin-antitoxin system HicB family antitoxin [Firmicutes bacterium]|nr:type II toxin-antitoxin system HicB family antitoxin [Bacillota bacterium]